MAKSDTHALERRQVYRLRRYQCVDGWYVKRPAEFRYLRSATPPRWRFRLYRWRWGCALLGLFGASVLLLMSGNDAAGLAGFVGVLASVLSWFEVLEPDSTLSRGELMWLHVRASDLDHDGPRGVARLSITSSGRAREFSMRLDRAAVELAQRDGSIDVLAMTETLLLRPRSSLGAFAIAFREHSEHSPASGTPVVLPTARVVGKGD